jgi:hypothetical protein
MSKENASSDEIVLFDGTVLKLPSPLEKIEQATSELLSKAVQDDVPRFWEYEKRETIWVPTDDGDGEIRAFHIKPDNPISKRPILLVPGWAVPPITFEDFYKVMHNKYELYYVETREKSSSRMKRFANFRMPQKAKDIGTAIKYFGLEGTDFILAGTCWGSAMIIQGLMDKTVDAPTIVLLDPMHYFAFSRVITFIAPIIPIPILRLLKPILKKQRLEGMKEKRQLERVEAVLDDIVFWKWKRTGWQSRNFEMFGNLHKIDKEVIVVNATADYIHQTVNYPNVAHQIPKGRFLRLETTEDKREYIFGAITAEFAKVSKDEFPESMKQFEVKIPRGN